jgi:hypothetical protein
MPRRTEIGEGRLGIAIGLEGQKKSEVFWGAKAQGQKNGGGIIWRSRGALRERRYLFEHAARAKAWPRLCARVCVASEGSSFGTPWIPKSGPHASPSIVDQKDDPGQ